MMVRWEGGMTIWNVSAVAGGAVVVSDGYELDVARSCEAERVNCVDGRRAVMAGGVGMCGSDMMVRGGGDVKFEMSARLQDGPLWSAMVMNGIYHGHVKSGVSIVWPGDAWLGREGSVCVEAT